MKKRLIVYGALAFMVVFFGGYLLGLFSGVSYGNCCRISTGMTAAEVEGLLAEIGQPPPERYGQPIRVPNQGCVEYWTGRGGTILVFYDTNERVIQAEWDSERRRESFLDKLWDKMTGVQQVRE